MDNFKPVDLVKAYKMMTGSGTKLIATKGNTKTLYNLTPIDWCMPMDYEPVTKIIFSCAPEHQCDANIRRQKEFAVCIPIEPKHPIIGQCGSVSDPAADKFRQFNITGQKAEKTDVMIPIEAVRGWIECKLIRVLREGSVDLIMGQAVAAFYRSGNGEHDSH